MSFDWKGHIQFFIEPHPGFNGTEEQIFTPRKGIVILFRFEGVWDVEGRHGEIEINYNARDLLVLALRAPKDRVIRVEWKRLISFELLNEAVDDTSVRDLLRIDKSRRN